MFSSYTLAQRTDLELLLGLDTPERLQNWIDIMSPDDIEYGLALLHSASLDLIDAIQARTASVDDATMVLGRFLKHN